MRRFPLHRFALILAATPLSAFGAEYWWKGQASHNHWVPSGFAGTSTNWRHSATSSLERTGFITADDEMFFAANDPDSSSFNTTLGSNDDNFSDDMNVASVTTVAGLAFNVTINPQTSSSNLNTGSGGFTTNDGNTLTLNCKVNTNVGGRTGILRFQTTGPIYVNSVISAVNGVNKFGNGNLYFNGNNTYDQTTTVHDGNLHIGTGGTSGGIAGPIDVRPGAGLVFNRSNNYVHSGTITGTGTQITITGSGKTTFTGTVHPNVQLFNGTLELAGQSGTGLGDLRGSLNVEDATLIIDREFGLRVATGGFTGTGTLIKRGSADLQLTTGDSFSGNIQLEEGTLIVGNGLSTPLSATTTINNQANLRLWSAGSTFPNLITGHGTVTIVRTTTYTANNTYTGLTTLDDNLTIGNGGTTGQVSGNIALNTRTLTFNRSNDTTYDKSISGTGAVIKQGAGTLTLTGPNSTAAPLTISGGTVQIGNGGDTGEYFGNIVNNSLLVYNRSDATGTPTITGTGSLTQLGTGTLTLANDNTYAGVTTISAGTLQLGNGGTAGSVAGNITNNSALIINRSNDLTYPGTLSGNGTLTKLGAGTLIITGDKSGTGLTTITTGLLQIGSGGTTGTIAGNIANNSALIFNRSNDLTYTGSISGSGTLIKLGAGTLTLPANQSFTAATTLSAGTLVIGGSSTGDGNLQGNVDINAGATLRFAQSNIVKNTSQFTIQGTLQLNSFDEAIATIAGSGAITTTAPSGILTLDLGSSADFSGIFSGPGGLILRGSNGPATQTLSGNNTYTGTTLVNGGTLQLGNGGTTGSVAGNIANNSALIFHRSNDLTYSGNISGSGSLTKLGAGTLTLTGSNTYTGGTTLATGTLNVGSANALGSSGALTFTGGTLQYSAANTADYSSRIANSTSPITIDTNGQTVTFASSIAASNTGGLTKLGTGTLTLTGNKNYPGDITLSAGTLQVGNGGADGSVSGDITNNASLIFNSSSNSGSGLITGTGSLTKLGTGTLTLTNDNTYSGGTTISAGTLQIGNGGTTGSISGNITNNAALRFNRASSLTYSGNISGTGSLTKFGAGTLTLTGSNTFSGGTTLATGTLNVGSAGSLGSSGALTFTGGTLQYSPANTTDYSLRIANSTGPISIDTNGQNVTFASSIAATNTGGLTKLGTGTLTLTGSNAYTGTTTISAGTLRIGSGGTTGSITADITNNASLIFNRSNNLTHSGNISGLGDLTKQGAGTLTLTGNITHTNGTTIQAGTLQIGSGTTTGSIIGNISNNTSLILNRSDSSTLSANISGPGSFTKLGTGTLVLTGSNSYTGTTTFANGSLNVGSTNALGSSGALTFTGGALQYSAANTTDYSSRIANSTSPISLDTNGQNVTFATPLAATNTSGLTKFGTGTLTLPGNHSYTGTTTVAAGTLTIGGSASGDGTIQGNITVNPGATLRFAQSNIVINSSTFTILGTMELLNRDERFASLAGSGSITSTSSAARLFIDTSFAVSGIFSGSYSGPGRLLLGGSNPTTVQTLSGDNTYTGGTTISAGILQIGSGGATGSLAGDITNNAALHFNRAGDLTYPGTISGTGTLTKLGTGSLILTGTKSGTGLTTISAGTLQIGNGGTTGSIAGNITNNSALIFNRSDDLTLPGLITGTGSLAKLGLGTLTLAPGQAAPYQMSALTITAGAINLTNNDLLLNYTGTSPISALIAYLNTATLTADGDFNGLPTALAIAESADLGLTEFAGLPIDDTTVIAKYTYVGDANLDGQVDALDYERIDLAIGNSGALGTAQGDLNYDGNVDALDYEQVDLNIGNGVGSPLASVFIPEPTLLAPLAAFMALHARRRRD
jgi:autotransporter-associated beta strand protein